MKKIITVLVLIMSLGLTAQNKNEDIVNKTKSLVGEYVDVNSSLDKVKDIEQLFVHYSKEIAEGSKTLVGNTVEIAEKAVNMLVEQSTIIVTQFIIYKSISYAIPIIFGFILLFWLPKRIRKRFVLNKDEAKDFNQQIADSTDIYKEDKKFLSGGNYYESIFSYTFNTILNYISYIGGTILIVSNIMLFIKVTFFSKLYLVELLLKYI